MDKPEVWVESITASDGSRLQLSRGDVVVIVGPNNSGKTAALKGVQGKIEEPAKSNPVIKSVEIARSGTKEILIEWLEKTARRNDEPPDNPSFSARGAAVHRIQAVQDWEGTRPGLRQLTRFFCHFLTAEERLATANPAPAVAVTQEPLTHPIHYVQRDDGLEGRLSGQFRRAFKEDLVVHRNAGSQVPLYVGKRPVPGEGQDRVSLGYLQQLEELPQLREQGDGMRSFSGVLLHAFTGEETVLLVDEPEAFLHPPQARLLGRLLVTDKPESRQLFMSTHSADVLRGVLDASDKNIRVVRIRREGDVNVITELNSARISELWSDPLLRYSSIFDGLFHEGVVLCESDSDCRFYEAVMDAIAEDQEGRRPDLLFTHCGGKDRMPMVLRALVEMGVPVIAVADFDVLNGSRPLKDIVEALEGDWGELETAWRTTDSAIRGRKPAKDAAMIASEIREVIDGVEGHQFPKDAARAIRRSLKDSSSWSTAKRSGTAYVPSGEATQACNKLLETLKGLGLHVVPVGEVESFGRSVGKHGPAWVNNVLRKNLKNADELKAARQFVSELLLAFSMGIEQEREASGA